MRVTLLLVVLSSSACSPVVQHGPWVRPGISGNVGAGAFIVKEAGASGDAQPWGSFDGGLRLGVTPSDSGGEGFSIGLQLPIVAAIATLESAESEDFGLLSLLHVDGYVAFKPHDNIHAAAGVTKSRFHTMPYVQLGRFDKWYVTNSFVLVDDESAWMWSPSFTSVAVNKGGSRTHLTLSGGLASGEGDVLWMAGFSIIFELTRARN